MKKCFPTCRPERSVGPQHLFSNECRGASLCSARHFRVFHQPARAPFAFQVLRFFDILMEKPHLQRPEVALQGPSSEDVHDVAELDDGIDVAEGRRQFPADPAKRHG